jgi:hypothetical protein
VTVALWPATLPLPQVQSQVVDGASRTDAIDLLTGPTRVRLARRHAGETFEFELWLSGDECVAFEHWYAAAVVAGGEIVLPWVGGGRVLAFVDEYQLKPQGLGWILNGAAVELRTDQTLCDTELNAMGYNVLRDPGPPTVDVIQDDGAAADAWQDNYDISLFEAC